ncbi:hypothetical protein RFI_29191 [Reticulomyxa filosa]|uniref:RNase H type-1 domain-containing protein n=1 Tax=Reticulomyxa filosa TaxID=46433 RepID=X6M1Z4_RETFI|nr:hypothetical protein RFI_29191 [Reticulomyxa filosa]|eukprot:ETO08198.1 hypothetical protein RFI_29191 [Reticulomyxa filosa]
MQLRPDSGVVDDNCVVIFCDASTYPNPGIGGAGLVIQDPNMPKWLELKYPINGITTNIGSEIEAMRLALKFTLQLVDECPDIASRCQYIALSMKYFIVGDRTWKPDIRVKIVKAAAKFVIDTKRLIFKFFKTISI